MPSLKEGRGEGSERKVGVLESEEEDRTLTEVSKPSEHGRDLVQVNEEPSVDQLFLKKE